jgi:hypothetical protein
LLLKGEDNADVYKKNHLAIIFVLAIVGVITNN